MHKIKKFIMAHKIISGIVVIAVAFGAYKTFAKTATAATQYTLGQVTKGTIVSTVSATGQVSATDQVDIKPKVSGEVTWVGVKAGQYVSEGQALMTIDNTDAKAAVADAEASLATAKLQLQKDTASAPIDFQKANDTLNTDKENLTNEYNNTFNALSTTYLDLPNVIAGMQNTLYGYDLSPTKTQYNVDVMANLFTQSDALAQVTPFVTNAKSTYSVAKPQYDAQLLVYKDITRTTDPTVIESLLTNSILVLTSVTQTLQSELNLLGTVIDTATQYEVRIPSYISTMQTNTRSYLTTANSDLSTLLSEKKLLTSAKQAITTDQQNIQLLQVGNPDGSTPISLQISQASMAKQETDLENLKRTLADYTVTAPFSGTLSSVSAQRGDTVGGAAVATIITKQQIATLSVNELDATKIALGDKATITFDAIDGLSLTGAVEQIDAVGTVSQGVVSYQVKITFNTQDPRVRPGMTANAAIQTAVHQDVLYVPSSAVKTSNGASYVLAFNPPLGDTTGSPVTSPTPPKQIPVQVGIADDTNVEITSGLTEGEQVVTRTTTAATAAKAAAAAPSATSLLGGGGNRGGGGNVRFGN